MDTNDQLAAYMDRAIENDKGLKVKFDTVAAAKRMQRYLINRRTADRKMQQKLHGLHTSRWDVLSFFLEGSGVRMEKHIFDNAQVEDL